jgi:ribose 5-phosphate isomerase RpiB
MGFEAADIGTHSTASTDYPDYAHPLAGGIQRRCRARAAVRHGLGYRTWRIGIGVRAAVAWTPEIASLAPTKRRQRAGAAGASCRTNAIAILRTWLGTEFEGGRHGTRVDKIEWTLNRRSRTLTPITSSTRARPRGITGIASAGPARGDGSRHRAPARREIQRQSDGLRTIASELRVAGGDGAMGRRSRTSMPRAAGQRYYGGCEVVDQIEQLAIDRAKQLFGADPPTQAHSGASANAAVFLAFLKPGDTFLGMDLSQGGHLTHGSPVNFSGLLYHAVSYGVTEEGLIDYDAMRHAARTHRPKMIIAGYSAYSRTIDWQAFADVAKKSAPSSWWTWRTSPDWWRPAFTPRRCRTPTSSPRPRTRRCAVRAAA